jgi:hypothetical protein
VPYYPTITVLGDTLPSPKITNLIAYDPGLNLDEYEGLKYESSDPNFILPIGGTDVPASFLTLRQGMGKYRPILKVTWRTTGSARLDWEEFVPGTYQVYLASTTVYWPEVYRGQVFLSLSTPNDGNLLNLPVIIRDGQVKRRVYGLHLGSARINARIIDGSGFRFNVIVLEGSDPYLSEIPGGLVLDDPGVSPTRLVGDTEVSTAYVTLKADKRDFRKPLQINARKVYDPLSSTSTINCNVYIASNQEEWDAVRVGYRGDLFLVESSSDFCHRPGHHSLFSLNIGQDRGVGAAYVGNVDVDLEEVVSPFTREKARIATITILDNPTTRLHLVHGHLVYIGYEVELIAGTNVDTRYLTVSSSATNFRYPLGHGRILYNYLRTEAIKTGKYHVYVGANTQRWDILCPGYRNQLFLIDASTDEFHLTFPIYQEPIHKIGAKYVGEVDLIVEDGYISKCTLDPTNAGTLVEDLYLAGSQCYRYHKTVSGDPEFTQVSEPVGINTWLGVTFDTTFDKNNLLFCGEDCYVGYYNESADGNNWSDVSPTQEQLDFQPSHLQGITSEHGYIYCVGDPVDQPSLLPDVRLATTILVSEDSGKTWQKDWTDYWQPITILYNNYVLPEPPSRYFRFRCYAKFLMFIVGEVWEKYIPPITDGMRAVSASHEMVIAVGENGRVLNRGVGSANVVWNRCAYTGTRLNGVSTVAGEYPFTVVVGDDGYIGFLFSGNIISGPFLQAPQFVTERLNGAWAHSRWDVFVVGDGGKILYFNGTVWGEMDSPTVSNLFSVHGTNPDNVYAAGDGVVIKWDGSEWTVLDIQSSDTFLGAYRCKVGPALHWDAGQNDLVYRSPDTYYSTISGYLTYIRERRLSLGILDLRPPLYFENGLPYTMDRYESGAYHVYISSRDHKWSLFDPEYRNQIFVTPAKHDLDQTMFLTGDYRATYIGTWHVILKPLTNNFESWEGYSIQESWFEDHSAYLKINIFNKSIRYFGEAPSAQEGSTVMLSVPLTETTIPAVGHFFSCEPFQHQVSPGLGSSVENIVDPYGNPTSIMTTSGFPVFDYESYDWQLGLRFSFSCYLRFPELSELVDREIVLFDLRVNLGQVQAAIREGRVLEYTLLDIPTGNPLITQTFDLFDTTIPAGKWFKIEIRRDSGNVYRWRMDGADILDATGEKCEWVSEFFFCAAPDVPFNFCEPAPSLSGAYVSDIKLLRDTLIVNEAESAQSYDLERKHKAYRWSPLIPQSFTLDWMPETKFDLGTEQSYQVYIAGIEDCWDELNHYYKGQLFLINSIIDPEGSYLVLNLDKKPAYCINVGKITATFQQVIDDFTQAFGHRCVKISIEEGSDDHLGITPDNILYFSDSVDTTRSINLKDVDVSYLEIRLPLFNYKDIMSLKILGGALDVQNFEPGDYYVYIGSDEDTWDSVNPDYRANLYLSKDIPATDNFLTIPLETGSITSKCIGKVSLSLEEETTHPNYHLLTGESSDRLNYVDTIDPTIEVGGYLVDVSDLSLLTSGGRYRLPLDPGGEDSVASRVQGIFGEYNVYIADNNPKWVLAGMGYRSQLFLSRAEPDPSSNLLNVLISYGGEYVQALKVGRVNVEWRSNYDLGIVTTWLKYSITLKDPHHLKLSVTEDGDLIFRSSSKLIVCGTYVNASYLTLREGAGKFRSPLVKDSVDLFSSIHNIDTGDYGVYLAPASSEWKNYAGKLFLSNLDSVIIDGKEVLQIPGLETWAIKLGEVTVTWEVIPYPMTTKPVIELDDQFPLSERLVLEDGVLAYDATTSIPFIPTAEGCIRLGYKWKSSLDLGFGVYRQPLKVVSGTATRPRYLSWEPGTYYVYVASIDREWEEYMMEMFLCPDAPLTTNQVFWSQETDEVVKTHYAYCLGRVNVRPSPYLYLHPYYFIATSIDTDIAGLTLSKFGGIVFRDVEEVRFVDGEQVPTLSLSYDPSSETSNFGLKKGLDGNLMKTPLFEGDWSLYLCSAKPAWGTLDLNADLFVSQLRPENGVLSVSVNNETVEALYLGKINLKDHSTSYTGMIVDWVTTPLKALDGDPPPLYYEMKNLGTVTKLPVGGTLVVAFTVPDAVAFGYPFSISLDCFTQSPFGSTMRVRFESWILGSEVDFAQTISSGVVEVPPVSSEFYSTYEYHLFSDSDPKTTNITKAFRVSDEIGCVGGLQIAPGDTLVTKIRFLDDSLFEEQSNSIARYDFFIKKVSLMYKAYYKA